MVQPAHIKLLSWCNTVKNANKKWKALVEYFSSRGLSSQKPNQYKRLIKLKSFVSDEDIDIHKLEKSIREVLDNIDAYFYTTFLQNALEHSSKYVGIFEKNDLDITLLYDHLLDYCDYYINKLRRFEHSGVTRLEIMASVITKGFETKYMMNEEEFEEYFANNFQLLIFNLLIYIIAIIHRALDNCAFCPSGNRSDEKKLPSI